MSRKGSPYSKLRRLGITDLSDHYLVRVLSQDRSQGSAESPSCLFINLYLVYSGYSVLHGVLYCNYVYFREVYPLQNRIQGCGLTASGGSCYKKYSVGTAYHLGKQLELVFLKTQF